MTLDPRYYDRLLTITQLGFWRGFFSMVGKKAFSLHVACVHQTFMDLTHGNVHSTAHFLSYPVREVANKQLSMDVQLIGGFNPSDSSGFYTELSPSVPSSHCPSFCGDLTIDCTLIPQKLNSQSSHVSLYWVVQEPLPGASRSEPHS